LQASKAHVCVYQTASDLIAAGYEVYVVGDAVSSARSRNKDTGIKMMIQLGAN